MVDSVRCLEMALFVRDCFDIDIDDRSLVGRGKTKESLVVADNVLLSIELTATCVVVVLRVRCVEMALFVRDCFDTDIDDMSLVGWGKIKESLVGTDDVLLSIALIATCVLVVVRVRCVEMALFVRDCFDTDIDDRSLVRGGKIKESLVGTDDVLLSIALIATCVVVVVRVRCVEMALFVRDCFDTDIDDMSVVGWGKTKESLVGTDDVLLRMGLKATCVVVVVRVRCVKMALFVKDCFDTDIDDRSVVGGGKTKESLVGTNDVPLSIELTVMCRVVVLRGRCVEMALFLRVCFDTDIDDGSLVGRGKTKESLVGTYDVLLSIELIATCVVVVVRVRCVEMALFVTDCFDTDIDDRSVEGWGKTKESLVGIDDVLLRTGLIATCVVVVVRVRCVEISLFVSDCFDTDIDDRSVIGWGKTNESLVGTDDVLLSIELTVTCVVVIVRVRCVEMALFVRDCFDTDIDDRSVVGWGKTKESLVGTDDVLLSIELTATCVVVVVRVGCVEMALFVRDCFDTDIDDRRVVGWGKTKESLVGTDDVLLSIELTATCVVMVVRVRGVEMALFVRDCFHTDIDDRRVVGWGKTKESLVGTDDVLLSIELTATCVVMVVRVRGVEMALFVRDCFHTDIDDRRVVGWGKTKESLVGTDDVLLSIELTATCVVVVVRVRGVEIALFVRDCFDTDIDDRSVVGWGKTKESLVGTDDVLLSIELTATCVVVVVRVRFVEMALFVT